MSAPYEAVLLAAGRGSRLHEHTGAMPKALLPIGPRSLDDPTETSFLRRQVELLDALGVDRIVVVVGMLREMILRDAETWAVDVEFVTNPTPDIGTSGSLHSFQFAARAPHGILDGTRQTLLMDADIVYEPRALELMLDSPERTGLLYCSDYRADDEEVLVYGSPERPRFLGKALRAALVAQAPCLGEATGIVKFCPADHALARQTMDWMLGDPSAAEGSAAARGFGPGRRATEHEELTQRFMHYERMATVALPAGVLFMECDDAAEYATVRNEFYPRILQLEADGADAQAGG